MNWSGGVLEYWSVGFWIRKTHYSIAPLLHHSILLISSIAPVVPGFRWAGGGVEQGALGHGAHHGAAIVGRRAHIANRFGLFGGDLANFLRECFAENLAFERRCMSGNGRTSLQVASSLVA